MHLSIKMPKYWSFLGVWYKQPDGKKDSIDSLIINERGW